MPIMSGTSCGHITKLKQSNILKCLCWEFRLDLFDDNKWLFSFSQILGKFSLSFEYR